MKPVGVKSSLAASRKVGSPFATMCALGVFPLGLNSSLEAVEIGVYNQLAGLQDVVVKAAQKRSKDNLSKGFS